MQHVEAVDDEDRGIHWGSPNVLIVGDHPIHQGNFAITPVRQSGIVGDKHKGGAAFPIETPEEDKNVVRGFGVKIASRFIGEDHFRR